MLKEEKKGGKGEGKDRSEGRDGEDGGRRARRGRKEGERKRRAEGSLCTSVISYSCSHTVPATPGQNLSNGECT